MDKAKKVKIVLTVVLVVGVLVVGLFVVKSRNEMIDTYNTPQVVPKIKGVDMDVLIRSQETLIKSRLHIVETTKGLTETRRAAIGILTRDLYSIKDDYEKGKLTQDECYKELNRLYEKAKDL